MFTIRSYITVKPRERKLPRLKPLCKAYRDNEYGVPVSKFEHITGLTNDDLYNKLVPMNYLTIVRVKKNCFILKDFYWLCLMDYLKSTGIRVIRPNYVKLNLSKTA